MYPVKMASGGVRGETTVAEHESVELRGRTHDGVRVGTHDGVRVGTRDGVRVGEEGEMCIEGFALETVV